MYAYYLNSTSDETAAKVLVAITNTYCPWPTGASVVTEQRNDDIDNYYIYMMSEQVIDEETVQKISAYCRGISTGLACADLTDIIIRQHEERHGGIDAAAVRRDQLASAITATYRMRAAQNR